MNYWLVKSEPESFSLQDFQRENITVWDGVRNYQARNNLKFMALGDVCIFYRSVKNPAAIALCHVAETAYPDPLDGQWVCVKLQIGKVFPKELSLSAIKADKTLANMDLLRLQRLSVQKVKAEEFDYILSCVGLGQ